MPTAFQCWVANTIAECGGDPIEYLHSQCGFAGLRALTYRESRIQHLSSVFFDAYFPMPPRGFAVVVTNLQTLH